MHTLWDTRILTTTQWRNSTPTSRHPYIRAGRRPNIHTSNLQALIAETFLDNHFNCPRLGMEAIDSVGWVRDTLPIGRRYSGLVYNIVFRRIDAGIICTQESLAL